jgi:N-methylhydantoinase A
MARYPGQVWELEVPLRSGRFTDEDDERLLREDFHDLHRATFGVSQPGAHVEVVGWRARAVCAAGPAQKREGRQRALLGERGGERDAWFAGLGRTMVPVYELDGLADDALVPGPALIESPFTTVVVGAADTARRLASGSLSLAPGDSIKDGPP